MGGRYHVKIGEQGFLLKPGSYRRRAVALNPELRTQNSEPGWRWWQQSDWRGGDGQRATGNGKAGGWYDSARWRSGYGVEVGEPGRVELGPSLKLSFLSPEEGFAAMLAFHGKQYALSTSSGKIYCYDGSGWAVDWYSGKGSMRSLIRHRDRLYAGSGSDGTVFVGDGLGWSTAFQIVGVASIASMASYEVWDPVAKATVPRLFIGCQFPDDEARIYLWDGTAATELHGCREAGIETMAVYRGKLYVATSETGNGVQGRVLSFDGRSGSGEWVEIAAFSDNYVAGMALFDNLIFCGSGVGGKLWAFDGDRLVEAYSLSAPGLEYMEPLRALGVCGGRLYVGYSHPTQGMALLCKLPEAGIGDRGLESDSSTIRSMVPGPQIGWFTPCTTGIAATPGAIAIYDGQLYLAGKAAAGAPIYQKDQSSHQNSGVLESSFFDGGQPTVSKLLRSLTLIHDKLLAGQYLEAKFALEGSDSFQQIERFNDLAGCDRDSTTVDWRPGDGLVRLKGMPAQRFTGKLPGDPAVPHAAYKLASPNPNSPPAVFAGEFSAAEYAAVVVEGSGVAVTDCTLEGNYSHQLFQFDLTGLNPVGLHPRAICYGRGDSFGVSVPGATFRIWNHVTGVWDVIGTNMAAPSDDVVVRTIEGTTTELNWYLSPSSRVYFSIRSSYSAGSASPSEVGTDLVELSAIWSGNGEVVSEPLRQPAAQSVSEATLTLLSSQIPAGTRLDLYLSADGGEHWEMVENGVRHSFAYPGLGLRWKAGLYSVDGSSSPEIHQLKVDYLTGQWLPLGRSDIEGSTSATFHFENGITSHRVAIRVELGSADPLGSPAMAGIALQYALQPETTRQWEMELLCEGVIGAPQRLLDGSQEGRTGRELSQILWQARTKGINSFEDLEGSQYQVWFEWLEEKLSDAAQERGAQTVASCRLTEC